jgi:hypothetical protein
MSNTQNDIFRESLMELLIEKGVSEDELPDNKDGRQIEKMVAMLEELTPETR